MIGQVNGFERMKKVYFNFGRKKSWKLNTGLINGKSARTAHLCVSYVGAKDEPYDHARWF